MTEDGKLSVSMLELMPVIIEQIEDGQTVSLTPRRRVHHATGYRPHGEALGSVGRQE